MGGLSVQLLLFAAGGHAAWGRARDAEMLAFVASSATESALRNFPEPQLGDLHDRFQGLPDSCEVIVEVFASSVNPADRTTPGPYPQVMGSDIAGKVVAVENTSARRCTRLQVGDFVWGDIGAIVETRASSAGSSTKGKENGAFARLAVALESQLGLVPDSLLADRGLLEAASLPKVALTSYKALVWYGGAPYGGKGARVLVLGGSGGTGSAALQLAKALQAAEVITTTSASNEDYARQLGADHVIDYEAENWWEVLPAGSLDVIYDTVGQDGTGDRAVHLLKPGGHYVTIVGTLPSRPRADVSSNMFVNSATNLNSAPLLDALASLVESEKLRMRHLSVYKLGAIADAFNQSATGHVRGKVVVDVADGVAPPVEELRV